MDLYVPKYKYDSLYAKIVKVISIRCWSKHRN